MNIKRCIICCIISKFFTYLLWRIYKFDRWHASAPWYCRPYKKQVVQLASSISPDSVLEIGCGLGDIISRIRAKERYGFDIDENAIKAANMIHNNGVKFKVASLFDIYKIKELNIKVDLIIMVNWPHGLSFDVIKRAIEDLKSELEFKYLLIDEIKHGVKGYKFYHSIEFLSKIGKIIKTVKAFDNVRNLHLIQINSK